MTTNLFQLHTNSKLRAIVLPGGAGRLSYDWVALTRFSEAAPEASGPMIYLYGSEDVSHTLEISIAPTLDVEIRKITITNGTAAHREVELTTYAEIALNHPLGDAGHPAFSKLFVQTSVVDGRILLARRRPRGMNENWPWMAQMLIVDEQELSWETNRATFLGRGRSVIAPAAMDLPGALSCQTGNVLDPVMAWRAKLALAPNESKTVWLITAAAIDELAVTDLMRQISSPGAAAELFGKAKSAAAERLNRLGIAPSAAVRYENLAATLLLGRKDRAVPESLAGSGVIHRFPLSWEEIRIIATSSLKSAGTRDLLAALPYWRALGLQARLFVMDTPQDEASPEGVTLTDPHSFSTEELAWWLASAQLIAGEEILPTSNIPIAATRKPKSLPTDQATDAEEPLRHFNSYGGFSADGREYVIPMALENGRLHLPPMPWINVLANPNFGCFVTERGAGYTWARNSQANRITPWSNDPICDPHGEAFYLQDGAELWSPLPGPCEPRSSFVVRHGFGSTRFLSKHSGLSLAVEFLVPPEDSIKLVSIRIINESGLAKDLNFSSYQKLLLGSTPDRHHATLAWSDTDGIQHAANPRAGDFAGGRVFSFATLHGVDAFTEDFNQSSAAFIGRGDLTTPDSTWKNGRGFGRDACFSRKISFHLPAGEDAEILITLSEVMDEKEEKRLIEKYRQPGALTAVRAETTAHWNEMLCGVTIQTPLPEVDLMVNGWLLYQNLACRIWGRSAFYQSGGAYGFRDQLQDSGALAALHPELMRTQILLHAAQQFPEGDVTHWWHPKPMGSGMRTKFADDLLWLPYLTDHYLQVTGDDSVLEEITSFIEGPPLKDGEDEEYMKPAISEKAASVFEHCCLAIDKSLTKGTNGLPLMGIGDWNDGMSRIGRMGKGESVWMGFFLFTILNRWIPLCQGRGETERVASYTLYRDELLVAINDAGWDGEWYRRAYYDDGTPLGTHTDDECRIDALAQAWAVISKAAPAERIEKSLNSLKRELVDPKYDIIRLLDPPFVDTPHDPGYIKGYVAGVRENGGQYTHAACWVVRAMAEAGRRDEAAEMLHHLSPIWHSRDAAAVARYQVEPYVVAADIYGAAPHQGRGGWTWYTGSAGWFFRVTVESVLGLRLENGDTLALDPRVPDDWPGFTIDYRTISGKTVYQILVTIPDGDASAVASLEIDGLPLKPQAGVARWPLIDDGGRHVVQIEMGKLRV